jgi:hypothetical protein
MSLAELKDQLAQLLPAEQREMIAFLIAQQTEREDRFRDVLARKIDDKDPAHSVDLDDLLKRAAK